MIPRAAYITSMLAIAFLGSFQLVSNGALALLVFALAFSQFYKALDTHIPILEITSSIAALQWLVGPVVGYTFGSVDIRYEMYIDADIYFAYAFPGTCAYLAALALWPPESQQSDYLKNLREPIFFRRGLILVVISLVAQQGYGFFPGSLAFFVSLLTQLRYIGALYFLFSGHPKRYLFVALSLSTLFIQSAEAAMFHDLIIWVSLFACYWFQTIKWTQGKKAMFLFAGLSFVFVIQLIKADYRAKIWQGQEVSILEVVYEKIFVNQAFVDEFALKAAGHRINQGWIISAIMANVPLVEPYAEGETVKDAVISAIFPRALMKDKKGAGGQENFTRFTGLILGKSTSMGISILGEGYANFGPFGGSVFMFFWGMSYAAIFRLAIGITRKHATFIFWLPLIFYQAIKAETELVVVLNQLFKGSIVAVGVYWALYKFIPSPMVEDTSLDPEENFGNEDEELPEPNTWQNQSSPN